MTPTIYEDLHLDFRENRSLQTIKIKQFEDRYRQIRIFLCDNGQPITFSGTETATINASVNGVVTTYDAECFVEDDHIDVPLYATLTTLAGKERCEVKITNPQWCVIYTATFILDVEPSVATSESAAVLKTTELASVLADHESRIAKLEASSGGLGVAAGEVTAQILTGTATGTKAGKSEKIDEVII